MINYPFTDVSFLILDDNWPYFLFAFLLPVLSYTFFKTGSELSDEQQGKIAAVGWRGQDDKLVHKAGS